MISDFLTFIHTILSRSAEAESIIPDSFRDLIPVDSIVQFLTEMNDSVKILGAAVTLIIALLVCFFGFKFSKIFMSITGFLAGALIGLTVSSQIFDLKGILVVLCTLLGGILLALFAYRIYMAGIFILCFMLAFMAAASLLPFSGDVQFFLSTLTGFIIGSLSLKFIRPVIILSSALVGGSTAGGLLATVCEFAGVHKFSTISTAGMTVIICGLGILVQFLTTQDPDKKSQNKKEE